MINFKRVKTYCRDDISLIENYTQALNATEIYDCHHRLETDLRLSRDELVEQGKYFNVPASELIFLTHGEHSRLHNNVRFEDPNERKKCGLSGENNPMWGKSPSEETRKRQSDAKKGKYEGEKNPMYGKRGKDSPNYGSKRSEETKKKQSEKQKGENNPNYGIHYTWMNNGIIRVKAKNQEEIEQYRKQGYHLGFKTTKGGIYVLLSVCSLCNLVI